MNWTSQTATAIQESTLMQRKTKQSHELSQIVELVKNGLTPAVRNTGGFHLYLFYSSSSSSIELHPRGLYDSVFSSKLVLNFKPETETDFRLRNSLSCKTTNFAFGILFSNPKIKQITD